MTAPQCSSSLLPLVSLCIYVSEVVPLTHSHWGWRAQELRALAVLTGDLGFYSDEVAV